MKMTYWFWQTEFPVAPEEFHELDEARSPWHETPEQIEATLEYGREKARLLRWVRRHMRARLTPRERRFVHLIFFRGLTYLEAARRTGVHPSVVHRSVQRGLAKLRRQLMSGRTRGRLRVTRFRGAAKDADTGGKGVY